MAFDDATRNRLSNFVTTVRRILTEEFSDQLRNVYGLDPDSGGVAEIDTLPSMAEGEKQTAVILRELLSHYAANEAKQTKNTNAELIDRIVREQSFTVLNRLCALRMAEARDLVTESVVNGYQSKGFRLYSQLAGAALGETGDAYRCYLQSVFDELAVDLPALFDRFSEYGRLFPRESVLQEVLDEVNHQDLQHLWAEDETIGWIYQYFNSKEERKAMRDASQAPRNSRELAVRNQFFTPRYVVEFLTDNTLGRIWYEMRKGETRLADDCQYLARRPNEIFLCVDDDVPKVDDSEAEAELTQEELLNQPVIISHRPLKDPREIRMLDPACGSMHFGLYAFDLYLKIYDEFWDLLAANSSVEVEVTELSPLLTIYESKDEFLKDVPRLIIEHNIHGIDIDPRAVQIAGLSLWLRAQRAWKSQGIASGDRPQVTRSNVVCAEPMPGDKGQLDSFCKQLHPAIAQMVVTIFEEMKLAGEAGSLLKIEQEVSELVSRAREQWLEQPADVQLQLFGETEKPQSQQLEFDLSGITDQQFFEQAEESIYEALRKYASATSEGGFRRKLFAGDAEKGFAFLDVIKKFYDLALTNPPFGHTSGNTKPFLGRMYPNSKSDLFSMSLARLVEKLHDNGLVGAITSRTGFFLKSFEKWRSELLLNSVQPTTFIDLGAGVLDAAAVETACYVCIKAKVDSTVFIKLDDIDSKEPLVLSEIINLNSGSLSQKSFCVAAESFAALPESKWLYWLPSDIWRCFVRLPSFRQAGYLACAGLQTNDDFRFIRLSWEVPRSELGSEKRWATFYKGGEYSPFYDDFHLVVNWRKEGFEIKQHTVCLGNSPSRHVVNEPYYFKSGLAYINISSCGFSPQVFPPGIVFSIQGQYVGAMTESGLALLSSSTVGEFLDIINPGRHYQAGQLQILPIPEASISESATQAAEVCVQLKFRQSSLTEESRTFQSIFLDKTRKPLEEHFADLNAFFGECRTTIRAKQNEIDEIAFNAYKIEEAGRNAINEGAAEARTNNGHLFISGLVESSSSGSRLESWWRHSLASFLVGCAFERWDCKKALRDFQTLKPLDEVPQSPVAMNSIASGNSPAVLCCGTSGPQTLFERAFSAFEQHVFANGDCSASEELDSQFPKSSFLEYLENSSKFFAEHLDRYSKSRRYAPIYWPIGTESGSYTLWFYYHRLTDQTLYKAVNDFVDPKLKATLRQLSDLRAIKDRSTSQEKELAQLTELETDLTQFKTDLLEIAAFWKPNLNDGVQITAAPLWKFFRLTKWRNKLKKTWSELESGKYDWAHLALSIWPDRVVREKCTTDRSIAIAHDLENDLWEEVEEVTESNSGKKTKKMIWKPKSLRADEIDAIIEQVKGSEWIR